ncbi:hypothetical protein RBA41_28310 [Massilia sp. CCM 9210]|uniref:hypothetical protein n=1 Tax=Massilia scottii TaxID=3057166 RepID=UPI002796B14A|nr:hypothetical protein [Massilia sp. CCM 9210]MDQ1817214.1 hypothetical protein [Massilia sp. CCM 9210]
MQSEDIPVRFQGFFSNTACLGDVGWKLALDEAGAREDMRMARGRRQTAFFHHAGLALTLVGDLIGADALHRDRHACMSRGRRYGHTFNDQESAFREAEYRDQPRIEIRSGGSKGQVPVHTIGGTTPFAGMSWRDTSPRVVNVNHSELHSLPLFAELDRARPETQELIVEPQSVQMLMDQILAAQGAMRKEIRVRDRQRDVRARQVHAQIVSLHS